MQAVSENRNRQRSVWCRLVVAAGIVLAITVITIMYERHAAESALRAPVAVRQAPAVEKAAVAPKPVPVAQRPERDRPSRERGSRP